MGLTSLFLAVVLTITGVAVYLRPVQAAGNTLDGITEIVSQNNASNKFNILEIVPDTAATKTVTDGLSACTVSVPMGTLGWLISGNEPVNVGNVLSQFDTTDERTDFMNGMKFALSSDITTDAAKPNSKPLFYTDYAERLEDMTDLGVLSAANGWTRLPSASVNRLTGISMNFTVSDDGTPSGNYVKRYYTVSPDGTSDNSAADYFNGDMAGTGVFVSADSAGDFDPRFTMDTSDKALGTYDVIFSATKARKAGFFVNNAGAGFKAGVSWDDAAYKDGSYVYTLSDNQYVFAGVLREVSGNVTVSRNEIIIARAESFHSMIFRAAGNVSEISGNEIKDAADPNTVSGDKNNGSQMSGNAADAQVSGNAKAASASINAASANDIAVSTDMLSEDALEAAGASENAVSDDSTYYLLGFEYTDSAADGTQLYQVKKYQKAVSGDYAVKTADPLAPNLMRTGTVAAVSDDASAGIRYTYSPGLGNYSADVCPGYKLYEQGAGIYYRGGFKNNDWFKQYVFDRTSDAEYRKLYITVTTVKASAVTVADVNNADLIYLSDTGSTMLPYQDADYEKYGVYDDLTQDVFRTILYNITVRNRPVMMDESLYEHRTAGGTFMDMLATALMADDVAAAYNTYKSSGNMNSITLKTDTDKTFVNKSVYVFKNVNDLTHNTIVNGNLAAKISETQGFTDITDQIANENKSRAKKDQIISAVNEGTAIRYIICYAQENLSEVKGDLNVLEIEPTDLSAAGTPYEDPKGSSVTLAYDLSVSTNSDANNPESWLLYTKHDGSDTSSKELLHTYGNINITAMSVQEYIGKVTDLNAAYDMIFIGDDTSGMNHKTPTDLTSATIYNDSNMNGLIYSNIGDVVKVNTLLSNGTGNTAGFRYSGNDIKRSDAGIDKSGNPDEESYRYNLIGYAKSGYPIVIANSLLSGSGVNTKTVDKNSNMYALLNALWTGSDYHVYKATSSGKSDRSVQNNAKDFAKAINESKLQLSVTSPTDTRTVLNANADGTYTVKVKFTVADMGDVSYTASLYMDQNADGKYSSLEKLDRTVLYDEDAGAALDSTAALTPGRTYSISRVLDGSYAGVIPWKLVVQENDNIYRRDSAVGYFTINKTDKEALNVLQIMTATTAKDNEHLNIQKKMSDQPYAGDATAKGSYSEMGYYLNNVPDFKLNVTSVSSDLMINNTNNMVSGNNAASLTADDYERFYEKYDMVIVGFADTYQWGNSTTTKTQSALAAEGLLEYIAKGYSVLFSHDCTSYNNDPNSSKWGYDLNQYLRDAVGMNRYGVKTKAQDLRNSNPYVNILLSGQEKYNENAYVPNSKKKSLNGSVDQGMTYYILGMNGDAYDKGGNLKVGRTPYYEGYSQTSSVLNSAGNTFFYSRMAYYATDTNMTSTKVTKVNDGQITEYPYKLSDSFNVNGTHPQYYQLNLNIDDDDDYESDVVVWYCLGEETGSNNTLLFKNSKNDVLNNYFIYSKGNVTYTGQGHKAFDAAYDSMASATATSGAADAEESRLLVNTIIAAYSAGVRNPKGYAHETPELTSRRIDSTVIPYDQQIQNQLYAEAPAENTPSGNNVKEFPGLSENAGAYPMEAYFEGVDLNVPAGGKKIYASFYYEDEKNGTYDKDLDMKLSPVTLLSEPADAVTGAALTGNNTDGYVIFDSRTGAEDHDMVRISFDMQNIIKTQNTAITGSPVSNHPEIVMKLKSSLWKHQTNVDSAKIDVTGKGVLKLLRAQLFNLK